jgi:hypothetical protein
MKSYPMEVHLLREIMELRSQIASQRRYIEELEKQLEPSVIAEIRDNLSDPTDPTQTY